MDHKWEDTVWHGLVLVFFGQVISESQTATSKLHVEFSNDINLVGFDL